MSPIYGRFVFGTQIPIRELLKRLNRISQAYLQQAPFHAYITSQEGETTYGLTHDELLSQFEQQVGKLKTISTAVTTADIRVMRVHIHFDPQQKGRGQFVISLGDQHENQVVKAILLGHQLPERSGTRPSTIQIGGAQPLVPKLSFTPPSTAFRKSYVTLNDHFFFSRKISIYELLALLDELSDKFMDYHSFHAQLETTDGDYYFDIQREELRYMFNQRQHTLLALYIYAANRQGYWIDMMLSFHPLEQGSNGEVEIHAPGNVVDEINALIWERITVAPSHDAMAVRLLKIPFSQEKLKIKDFISFFNRLVHRYLFQVPPVASVTSTSGKTFTGLSFYQLAKMYHNQSAHIQQITVDVTQVVTGQNCQLILNFSPEDTHAQLNLMLGDEVLHQQIQGEVNAFFAACSSDLSSLGDLAQPGPG